MLTHLEKKDLPEKLSYCGRERIVYFSLPPNKPPERFFVQKFFALFYVVKQAVKEAISRSKETSTKGSFKRSFLLHKNEYTALIFIYIF